MKIVIATALLVVLGMPALVGSAAGAVAPAPAWAAVGPLFGWVPAGGFRNAFPFGQCTWWAAYNRNVSWTGNAADWLATARAQRIATDEVPTIGAIAVYTPGGQYSRYGHVAIVTDVGPTGYAVSEMNAPGWGQVTVRRIAWPDPAVAGFIPLTVSERVGPPTFAHPDARPSD